MRFKRLIQFVATNSTTPSLRARLADLMSHRVPPQCAAEACALSDFTQLSMTDLNEAWVTQLSAEAYSRHPTSWDSEQHVLLPAQLTSSDEVTRMNAQHTWNRNLRSIGTRTFFSTPTLSVTAFVLPAGTQLDLHDHPGMTVLQALLVGNLSALSLDWADSSLTQQKEAPTREGVVVHSGIFNEGDRHVIRPSEGGVLHHLSSHHDQQQSSSSNSNGRGGSSGITVFVDFITPPYFAPPACSLCTYYKLSATKGGEAMAPRSYTSSLTKGDKVWLTPDHTYDGPDMVPLIPVG